jgi:hypothetical protein
MGSKERELIAVSDFIVLELPEKKGVVELTDQGKKNVVEGAKLIVCKVGPKCKKVKTGDSLIVAPEAIVTFVFEKQQYFLTREENVGCIIR